MRYTQRCIPLKPAWKPFDKKKLDARWHNAKIDEANSAQQQQRQYNFVMKLYPAADRLLWPGIMVGPAYIRSC